MKKCEFKSQVATTKEQSERLLTLGLKAETADMVYHYTNSCSEAMRWELRPHPPTLRHTTHINVDKLNVFKHKKPDGSIMTGEEYFQELWGKDIPAWSLHRLLEMLYADIGECMIFFPNTYDEVIADIEDSIRRGQFNQDYLEDKK